MTDDDSDLWQKEVADVNPLKGADDRIVQKSLKKQTIISREESIELAELPDYVRKTSESREVDRKTLQTLKRGQMPIEGRLDMHGMNKDRAYDALKRFVVSARVQGKRCLIVITGKGQKGYELQGVLRAEFSHWMHDPFFAPYILHHVPAQQRDGGHGAFYIYLKRKR